MDESREWFKKSLKKIYGFDYGHHGEEKGYGQASYGHNYAPYTHH